MKSFKFEMLYNLKLYGVFFLVLLTPSSRLIKYNHEYFGLSAVEYLLAVAFLSFVLYLASFVLRLILGRERLFVFALLVLIASVVMVYFVPVQLAVIDGNEHVDFALREEAAYFLYLLPIFFLLVFFIERLKLYGLVKTISQFSALYVIAFAAYGLFSVDKYIGFTGSDKGYELPLSSVENIFVISFDQVQGTLVSGMLEDDPGQIQSVFKGFTFYPDAASTYPNTNYSMASVVLGRTVDDASESFKSVIDSDKSFLSSLKLNGFNVYLGGAYAKSKSFSCVTCSGRAVYDYLKGYEFLRHAFNFLVGVDFEGFIKRILGDRSSILLGDATTHAWKHDIEEFSNLIGNAYVSNEKPAVFFMHFLATHQPFTYTQDCNVMQLPDIGISQDTSGAKQSFECVLNNLSSFFQTLERLGVFESSEIYIYSDHGYEFNVNSLNKDSEHFRYLNNYSAYLGVGNIKPVGSYNPIMFYKASGVSVQEDFRVSPEPVSLIDIAGTICTQARCGNVEYSGGLNNKINSERGREFWLYKGGADRRMENGEDKLHDGLDSFWEKRSFTGPIYPNLAHAMGLVEEEIKLEQALYFTVAETSEIYISTGWSGQEPTHRWTDGSKATLQLPLDQSELNPSQALRLRLQANGFSPKGKDHQPVTVMVNGIEVAQWQLRGVEWHEAIIPAEVVAEQWPLRVDFLIAEPTAPCDVSSSKDCRKLGMAARELVLEAVESGQ